MNEILRMLNELNADELDGLILRANLLLEKKRKEEAEQALLEKERLRQEKIKQEQKRQQEIAELQRKLQELQRQRPDTPEPVNGDGFVMHEAAVASQARTNPVTATPASQPVQLYCPHCGQANAADSKFCANCGQQIRVARATASASSPAPAAQAHAGTAVRYADESMKAWEKRPNEYTIYVRQEIKLLQPNEGKFAYSMEVTDQRILLTREKSSSKNAGMMARMGVGGLVGGLVADAIHSAGAKPWLEIPLTSVSSCGIQNDKEFYIVADQTYVLKNKKYEKFLPDLVAKAKAKEI